MGIPAQSPQPEQLSFVFPPHEHPREHEASPLLPSFSTSQLVGGASTFFLLAALLLFNQNSYPIALQPTLAMTCLWLMGALITLTALWCTRLLHVDRPVGMMFDVMAFLIATMMVMDDATATSAIIMGDVLVAATLLLVLAQKSSLHFFEGATRRYFDAAFPILKVLSDALSKNPLTLNPGVWIRIAQGERIPVDGSVISGEGVIRDEGVGSSGALRISRSGDEVKAGELLLEGALAVKVEKPWPYHQYAQRSRFAESCFDAQVPSPIVLSIFEQAITAIIISCFVAGMYFNPISALVALVILASWTLFCWSTSSAVSRAIIEAGFFGALYRAGIVFNTRNAYTCCSKIDGLHVAAGNENYPVVRKESIFADEIDATQFAKIVLNLIGPVMDDWAVALKEYLMKKIPFASSILQGVKGLSRFSANGLRGEFEGHELIIGDEAALRSRGITLELSEVSLSVKDATVFFVAINGDVAARYEIELFPSLELMQQLEHASEHGLFIDVKTQKNIDIHQTITGVYKCYTEQKECCYVTWEPSFEPWTDVQQIARCVSRMAFMKVPKALIKARILMRVEWWSYLVALGILSAVGLYTLLNTGGVVSLITLVTLLPLTVLLTAVRNVIVGIISSEQL